MLAQSAINFAINSHFLIILDMIDRCSSQYPTQNGCLFILDYYLFYQNFQATKHENSYHLEIAIWIIPTQDIAYSYYSYYQYHEFKIDSMFMQMSLIVFTSSSVFSYQLRDNYHYQFYSKSRLGPYF